MDPVVKFKIAKIARTFSPPDKGWRGIADTVEAARLYRIGYCQDGRELRADYYEYVYANSFARRRRRKPF